MASTREIHRLSQELERLAAAGVIAADVPARVRAHYAGRPRSEFPVLGVLGATLVGLGVVLILASNWEALSAPVRATICVAALVAAQALAGFALWRRPAGAGWCEAAGVVGALAVVSASALVNQTYQAQTTLAAFLWQCALLSLPPTLLLQSRGGAVLVLCASWTLLFADGFAETAPHRFWMLTAAIAGFTGWLHARRDPVRPAIRDALLGWLVVATILLGATFNFGAHFGGALVLVLAATAAGLHAWGRERLEAGDPAFLNAPAARLGGLAVSGIVITFCFGEVWAVFGQELDVDLGVAAVLPSLILALVGGALAGRGALGWLRAGQWARLLFSALPLALALAWGLALALEDPEAGALAVTAYGLAAGVGTLLAGVREASAARANLGLLLVAAVVGVRFFDDDWSFAARGLAFIALGVAFLILNLQLRRARAEDAGR